MPYVIKGNTADWEAVIGLEVHCQVISKSKLFSSSSAEFGAQPNEHVSLVDAAMPGMLPVLNEFCIRQAVKTGFGLNAKINKLSRFDRKSYFYADLPSGYQITQQYAPIVTDGYLDILDDDGNTKRIRINRLHVEQDAGKSVHDMDPDKSFIDLNRAGVALMEIVSEPDLSSPFEVSEYLKKMRQLVRYLKTCDGNMDEGSMRCDLNVSVRKVGETKFGTRVEVKNVNSVKYAATALEYEIKRQINALENGEELVQETRLFNPNTGETRSMRSKENANDYRYFPDPDLLPVVLSDELLQEVKNEMPMLPDERKAFLIDNYSLSAYDADVLSLEKEVADFFEKSVSLSKHKNGKHICNLMTSELFAYLNKDNLTIEQSFVSEQQLADIADNVLDNVISGKIAKDLFKLLYENPDIRTDKISDIIEKQGLKQVSDTGAIEKCIDDVIANNTDNWNQLKSGKDKLIGWFVGQVMKEMKGKGNPSIINELIIKKVKE